MLVRAEGVLILRGLDSLPSDWAAEKTLKMFQRLVSSGDRFLWNNKENHGAGE